MAKRKQPMPPLVTSITSIVKKVQDTQPFTKEEVIQEKRALMDTLKDSFELYGKSLARGDVILNSSLDLDRIVKLMLMVMGEPEGVAAPKEETTTVYTLSPDDPDVMKVYEKLANGMNELNDTEE